MTLASSRLRHSLVWVSLLVAVWQLFACAEEIPRLEFSALKIEDVNGAGKSVDELHAELVQEGFFDLSEAEQRTYLPVEEISFEGAPCYGTCPVYKATLYRDGHASLDAYEHVEGMQGHYEGPVSSEQFAFLCLFLKRFRFRELKSRLIGEHGGALILSVRSAETGQVFSVSEPGYSESRAFFQVSMAVRAVMNKTNWVRTGEVPPR